MDDQRTVLTRGITFAEDWLARARRQVEDGEHARGILTLLLAEAEVHRARELGAGGSDARPARVSRAAGPVAVVAAAVIIAAAAFWRPFGPAAPSAAAAAGVSPHPIVTLSAGTGSLLRLVHAPEATERTVTVPVVVHVRIRVPAAAAGVTPAAEGHVAVPTPVRPPAAVQPAARRPEPSLTAGLPPAAPESTALLSEAELIDLVLATERSLRRSTNQ